MRKTKKILALGLSIMMSVSLMAGCGTKGDKEQAKTESEGSDSGDEAVTLKVYGAQSYGGTFTAGVQDDPVFKDIEEKTGVTLDWDFNISTDKYNAYVASGDIPDIFVLNSTADASALIKSGAVMDLTDLVDENLPDFLKIGEKALEFSKEYMSDGTGNVYFIPGRLTVGEKDSVYSCPNIGFYIRLDYYKEAGAPEINSYSDVVDLLIKIHENHPTTDDGQPTYAFSMWQDWGLWYYTVASEVIQSTAGVTNTTAKVAFVDKADGYRFVDGLLDEESPLWVDGAMFNQAYQAGLMDPNSFTQTNAQATTTMNNGQVLCELAQWLTTSPNTELMNENPDNPDAGYVNILMEDANYGLANYSSTGLAQYWCISSKCKNPERALQVINYLYTEEGSRNIYNGVKGETWDEDENGNAYYTDYGLEMLNNPDNVSITGAGKIGNYAGIDIQSRDFDGQFINLAYEPAEIEKTLLPVQKSWLEFYGVESETELWEQRGGYVNDTTYDALFPAMPSDIARIDTKIASYMTTAMPLLIMAEDDAAFEAQKQQIIQDVQAIEGYEEYMDWCRTSVEETAAKAAEYE